MKKILVALFSFAFVSAQAQTADEIIQKYCANMGGLDAINKITTAKMTGIATLQGMDLPFTTSVINGRAMKTEVEVMGQQVVNCYKDGKGWKINPFAGAETATDVAGTELNDFKSQAFLLNPLMDYKKRGNQVELLGQEDVEGVKTFKIKMTAKEDGKLTTYFINTTDFMLNKSITARDIQGQTTDVETLYKDFKEFGGVKFSMSRSQKANGQELQAITLNNVELNVAIDEKIFDK